MCLFFFQAEDGIRDLVRSRGLGDVYKRQRHLSDARRLQQHPLDLRRADVFAADLEQIALPLNETQRPALVQPCLLYTSDAADERSSVDLGGRRIIKKKKPL